LELSVAVNSVLSRNKGITDNSKPKEQFVTIHKTIKHN